MLYSEFYNLTKVEVDADEYAIIEEAYYDFPGDKYEFCKWWLKAHKNGYWLREKELRMALNNTRELKDKRIMELTESYADANATIEEQLEQGIAYRKLIRELKKEVASLKGQQEEYNKIMDALSVLKNAL